MLTNILPTTSVLILLSIISGILHIYFDYKKSIIQTYFFKPLTILLIIVIATNQDSHISPSYKVLIITGLFFSLAGDVFLMLKKSDLFIQGLSAFAAAHLVYLIAIVNDIGFQFNIYVFTPIIIFQTLFLWKIQSHLGSKKKYVLIYVFIIIVLLWQAISRATIITNEFYLLAALGILLFTISDSVLAYNKFVRNLRFAQIIILTTYYSAQILLALSI
jgi:uncharacterized membrane protein YhhN